LYIIQSPRIAKTANNKPADVKGRLYFHIKNGYIYQIIRIVSQYGSWIMEGFQVMTVLFIYISSHIRSWTNIYIFKKSKMEKTVSDVTMPDMRKRYIILTPFFSFVKQPFYVCTVHTWMTFCLNTPALFVWNCFKYVSN